MTEHEAEINRIAVALNEAGVLDRRYIYTSLMPYSEKIQLLGDTDNTEKVRVALDYMLTNEINDGRNPGLWPMLGTSEGGVYPPYINDPFVHQQCVPVWRQLVPLVNNAPVAARLHDALWISEQGWKHGRDAIRHYRDSAEAHVPDAMTRSYLERAYYIAKRLNQQKVQHKITDQAASILRRAIDNGTVLPDAPGVFLPLLDLATAPALDAVPGIKRIIRDCYRIYSGNYRHKLAIVTKRKRVPLLSHRLDRLDRLKVRIVFDQAKRAPDELTRELMLREALIRTSALKPTRAKDKETVQRLHDEIGGILQQPTDTSQWQRAIIDVQLVDLIKYLGHGLVADFECLLNSIIPLPDENEIDVGLVGLFPVAVYDEQAYRLQIAQDSESSTKHYRSQSLNVMMYATAASIGEGVEWIIRRYKPSIDVLTNILADRGVLSEYHARVFAKTLFLFKKRKYDECVYIAVPRLEGALRRLASDSGVHTYRAKNNQFMTLPALVKELKEHPSFGEFARWFEAGLLGDHFRNLLAHDRREREAIRIEAARCVLLIMVLCCRNVE